MMKKAFYVFAIAFMAVLSLGFVSCSNNDDPSVESAPSIVGTWKGAVPDPTKETFYMRLAKDGSYMSADWISEEPDTVLVYEGTWKVENDSLSTFVESGVGAQWKIVNLKQNSFTMTKYNEDDKVEDAYTFTRVTDSEMDEFIAKYNKNK